MFPAPIRPATLRFTCIGAAMVLLLAGCGGEKTPDAADAPKSSTPAAAAPTGTVITIEMTTDDKGSYFIPSEIEAKPGDVLKFVLVTGVHNVHFLPDSNPGAANLPPMSTFAQLPGQAIEIPVTMAAGSTYYFQCDPHAALGMKGHVKVQ